MKTIKRAFSESSSLIFLYNKFHNYVFFLYLLLARKSADLDQTEHSPLKEQSAQVLHYFLFHLHQSNA